MSAPTVEELDRWDDLAGKATPGSLHLEGDALFAGEQGIIADVSPIPADDLAFIAASREAVPRLVEEVRRLRERLAAAERAIEVMKRTAAHAADVIRLNRPGQRRATDAEVSLWSRDMGEALRAYHATLDRAEGGGA